jgi:hypothetical protein
MEENVMKKMKFGILLVVAVLVLVSAASALPSSVDAKVSWSGSVSFFDVQVVNGGDSTLPNQNYLGWCGAFWIGGLGQNGALHTFTPYDSRYGGLPSSISTYDWNRINYAINHKPNGDSNADIGTIQSVIWHYADQAAPVAPYDPLLYQQMIADADANGGSYNAHTWVPGERYSVILWQEANIQPVIIEVPIPGIPTPEFPVLALPVAMLIGLVGAVVYIKERKE